MTITTNNHPRPLQCLAEVSHLVGDDFDYIESDDAYSPRLFKYRGQWYDVADGFLRIVPRGWPAIPSEVYFAPDDSPLCKWHSIQPDSHNAGVVIKYHDNYRSVVVGFCYS